MEASKSGAAKGLLEMASMSAVTIYLPFWGKVVSAAAAANVSKNNCLPLGGSTGLGPALFLDGAAVQNIRKADACMARLVPTAPQQKGDDKDEEATATPAKRARKTTPKKGPMRATHRVSFEKKIEITIEG
eukprot:3200941-Pyramimonas_sp.AAC.1